MILGGGMTRPRRGWTFKELTKRDEQLGQLFLLYFLNKSSLFGCLFTRNIAD